MTAVTRDSELLRVEHVIFGYPGDLGFDLVSYSVRLADADHRRLAGLCENNGVLQQRAISVARLTNQVAVIVSHPDRAPRKRAGAVVSHAFLVEAGDYERIGCNPLVVLDQVKELCGERLPNDPAKLLNLEPHGTELAARVRDLRLPPGDARRLAPAVAARLVGARGQVVVKASLEPFQCIELILAMSTRAGRRDFSFATSSFSREAHTLDLIVDPGVAVERAPALAPEIVDEAEHLLRLDPEEAAERIATIDRRWPTGFGPEASGWLRMLRLGDDVIAGSDRYAMLEAAKNVLHQGGHERAATRVAVALCVRACCGDDHRPDVLAELPTLLLDCKTRGVLHEVLARLNEELSLVRPDSRLCVVACVERFCCEHGFHEPFAESAEQLLLAVAVAPVSDASSVDRIQWILDNAPPRAADVIEALEHFAWCHNSKELRFRVIALLPPPDSWPVGAYRASRFSMLKSAISGGERAVEAWLGFYVGLLAVDDAVACLESILRAAEPGPARCLAVERLLDRLDAKVTARLPDRLPEWLTMGNSDDAIGKVVTRIAKAILGTRSTVARTELLRVIHMRGVDVAPSLRHELACCAFAEWPAPRTEAAEPFRDSHREWQGASAPHRTDLDTDVARHTQRPALAGPVRRRRFWSRRFWRRVRTGTLYLGALVAAAAFLYLLVVQLPHWWP